MAFIFGISYSQAQDVNIPDPIFRFVLVNYNVADFDGDGIPEDDVDLNDDGQIQVSEAESVLGIQIDLLFTDNIQSIEGIASFGNLEWLDIFGQQISDMDLSQNASLIKLYCNNNDLQSLLLPTSTNLLELTCLFNQLTSLDVSENPNLEILKCGFNEISNIDVSQNLHLQTLVVDSNLLTAIDITNNTNLTSFFCSVNEIASLDVTQNIQLVELEAMDNLLTGLDVSHNVNLENLWLTNNSISQIDVSQNNMLAYFYIDRNQLTEIDVSLNGNLTFFSVNENQLTGLDVSSNHNLGYLYCHQNNLNSLNVKNGNNTSLFAMAAHDNPELFCIQVDDENATYPECDPFFASGWCYDGNVIFSENCELGLNNFFTNAILLYPNPANEILILQTTLPIEKVAIYSRQGILVGEYQSTNKLEVSHLSKGLYFVEIRSEGKLAIRKFLKL
ncbi:MAG TPA: T9SS type A sorting domain-containing protein [Flavobacteriaceae bacterium]|nr:T9SS type A sorting domain-containing protein [Flavobacteriaceae bacterium]MCB9213840.1 T9SS type A sorting domain-containing protein [Alteromonas sp.]HPF11236.1 T9SS type A sorting domain-containing protein [Flavobacteriaceae bacterium]HQU21715.1 T9SS type A sorting domain-containing protein [Flavobacteriaceae bacterium]HQU64545.1 T9SS type A sorting domain-containing protein [Flavobacteriaceae bacterium]